MTAKTSLLLAAQPQAFTYRHTGFTLRRRNSSFLFLGFKLYFMLALFEAVGVVFGFDDGAVVCDTIEQCGRHLGISKDTPPFTKVEVSSNNQTGFLVQFTD